jgi:pre-mRNA-splicing factor ATP-dependent RNA helicase DHX38/PRP16
MNSADHDKWELNRMITGGAVKLADHESAGFDPNMRDAIEVEEDRVLLLVHDIKPPFLDGRETFTKQTKPVQVVRDPTSDFAVLAKKGSSVLRFVRERQDRQAMREKFWNIAGTKMGNIVNHDKKAMPTVKVDEQTGEKEKVDLNDEVDYKATNQYANSLTKKQ